MEKGILKIDFTENGDFKEFNNSVKSYLKKHKSKKNIQIIDYVYSLGKNLKNVNQIKDHINLSGKNSLSGPNFISLTNIYNSKKGIVVSGLSQGVHPNNQEKKILLKIGANAYCYSLVPTVIFAASQGFKIKAIGIKSLNSPQVN